MISIYTKSAFVVLFKPAMAAFFLILAFSMTSIAPLTAQCGTFRTQTQGGWGGTPKGNNPAMYLQRNFNAAFPNGLTIGCTNKLVLTSAKAVSDFLPSGGTASVLPSGTRTNVGTTYNNVFAGQVVALKISVVFDDYDANFAQSTMSLKDLKVKEGVFAGVSVATILREAEKAIGGCTSLYSISDLNNVISRINENFVDGTKDLGFLTCSSTDPCANDATAPVFVTVPESYDIGIDTECYTADWALPTVSDNCGSNISLTSNINIGDCLPEGIHTVTYTATDAAGNTSTVSFTVTVFYNDWNAPLMGSKDRVMAEITRSKTQDIDNQSNSINFNLAKKDKTDDIKVFPNPASQFVNIDLTSYNNSRVQVVLYNTVGAAVRRQTVESGAQSLLQMPLFNLPNGQYIISVTPENQTSVIKRIVVAN